MESFSYENEPQVIIEGDYFALQALGKMYRFHAQMSVLTDKNQLPYRDLSDAYFKRAEYFSPQDRRTLRSGIILYRPEQIPSLATEFAQYLEAAGIAQYDSASRTWLKVSPNTAELGQAGLMPDMDIAELAKLTDFMTFGEEPPTTSS